MKLLSFAKKISAGCLRHSMFNEEMSRSNSSIIKQPLVLFNALARPEMIVRGYMFADDDIEITLKKKSVFNITDALADGAMETIVRTEIGTRSGAKKSRDTKVDEDSKGDTSMFFTESVGEHDYTAKVEINLDEMQFMSVDTIFDRCSVDLSNSNNRDMFIRALENNFKSCGMTDVKTDQYYLKTSICGDYYAEEGILFNKKAVDMLTKLILRKITNIVETRPSKGGMLSFVTMDLQVMMEDGSEETITINSAKDIDNYSFKCADTYVMADEEAILNRTKLFEELASKENKGKGK